MSQTYCVVVADSARARVLRLEPGELPVLTEDESLVHPERRLRASELMSEPRPGLRRAPSGPTHGVDDRRDGSEAESDRRFATAVAEALERVYAHGCTRLVVVASPHMLGVLRQTCGDVLRRYDAEQLARDVSKLSPAEIHDYLAGEGVLPPRKRL